MAFKVQNLGKKPAPFPKIFYHLNFSLKNPNLAGIPHGKFCKPVEMYVFIYSSPKTETFFFKRFKITCSSFK